MSETTRKGRRKRRQTKDRVIQARIPEQLDEELRDRAEQLGLSVSTIVRNVLFHTFDLVEGVVADSAQIARAAQGREKPRTTAAPPSPEGLPAPQAADLDDGAAVVGWQEAVLNKNGICEQCNAILQRGERAALGVPIQPRPILLCLDCLAALSGPVGDPAEPVAEPEAPSAPSKKASVRSRKSPK